jgi:hypothetical protein
MHQHLIVDTLGREQLAWPQQCHDRRAHSTMKQRELHLLGAVPKEPPRREQRPPAERPAKHLYEHHCAWDHQHPAPVLLLPEHLFGHGGVRHDTHAPGRGGSACSNRSTLLQSSGRSSLASSVARQSAPTATSRRASVPETTTPTAKSPGLGSYRSPFLVLGPGSERASETRFW